MWLLALAASQAATAWSAGLWHRQVLHERPDCYTNDEVDQTKCPGKRALRLITPRPHSGGVGDALTKEIPMFKMALKAVNNHATLLPDYIMELWTVDSKCSVRPGVQSVLDQLLDKPAGFFHGVFGPTCSDPTAAINDALSSYNILHAAPHSRSSALQSGARYPNLCRLSPTLGFVVEVVNDVVKQLGWTRIGVFSDATGLSGATQGLLVNSQEAEAIAGTYPFDAAYTATHVYQKVKTMEEAMKAAEEIKAERPPVLIFAGAYENVMFRMGCAFHKIGVKNGDGIQMMHAGAWFAETWMEEQGAVQGAETGCTAEDIFGAMKGLFAVSQQQFKSGMAPHEITGEPLGGIRDKYFEECVVDGVGCHPDFSPYSYDGIALFAQTFHDWLYDGGHSLDEITYTESTSVAALHDIMMAQDFAGLTGQVAFFQNIELECERKGEFSLKQYNTLVKQGADIAWEPIAGFSEAAGWAHINAMSWADGTTTDLINQVGMENIPQDYKQCDPGTKYGALSQTCEPCEPGFESREGKDCTQCPPGFYAHEPGMGRCLPCGPGTFVADSGATTCSSCSAGLITPAPGMDHCMECEPGTASNEEATECVRCAVGMYQDGFGKTECELCPDTFITSGVGAADAAQCTCAPGTFWNRKENTCDGCPAEAFCPGGSSLPLVYGGHYGQYQGDVSAATLKAQEDAKAAGTFETDPAAFSGVFVFKCSSPKVCRGETMEVPSHGFSTEALLTKENLRVGYPLEGSCMENRVGIACGRCADSMYGLEECKDCGAAGLNYLALIAAPFVVLVGYHCAKPTQGRARLLNAFILASLCGMLVFFIQSLAVLGSIDVGWPPEMNWIFTVARVFLFDFSGLTFACWTGNGFLARYLSSLLAPMLLLLMTAVAFFASKLHPSLLMEPGNTVSFIGMLLTAFYVTLVKHIMTFFECSPNPGAGTPDTLQNYRDVPCESSERDSAMGPMVLGMMVYVIGFYLVNCYLAYVAPVQWNNAKFRQYCRFLVNRWRPDFWWWGIAVLTRNVLVASSGLFGDDVSMQLLVLTALVTIYSVLVAQYQPWVVPGLNRFEVIATLLLALLGTVGLIFNSFQKTKSILTQLDDAWAADAVVGLNKDLKRFGIFILVILVIFIALFVGLLLWCLAALPSAKIAENVRKLSERQTSLLGEVKQVVESDNFSQLLEAVIVHGTDYDRARLDELLRKFAAVAFTKSGKVDDAFIRPPSHLQAAELQETISPKAGAVVSA